MNEPLATVDVLLFRLRGVLCGADASQVLRIDHSLSGRTRDRSLVFQGPDGESHFHVDTVHGVRSVSVESLRRPPTAVTVPGAIGFWLDGDKPVLLLDLQHARDAQ